MKLTSLWRMLIFIIIIIIIIGGTIIIIIIRNPIPPIPCRVCGFKGLQGLGIAEVVLGIISLGLINKIRNIQKF
jgi:hypothetical protein